MIILLDSGGSVSQTKMNMDLEAKFCVLSSLEASFVLIRYLKTYIPGSRQDICKENFHIKPSSLS